MSASPTPDRTSRTKTTKTTSNQSAKTAAAKSPVARKMRDDQKNVKAPKTAKSAQAVASTKGNKATTEKLKKPKLVRDSFTIPKNEYESLDELKRRCAKLKRPAKKSELLRAGLHALTVMSDAQLLAAVQAVPSIKTGRPKKL